MTGASIVELSRSLHAKRLSAVELTQAMLDRIANHNPVLNAFITVDSEGALAAAKEADARIAKGEAGAFVRDAEVLITWLRR